MLHSVLLDVCRGGEQTTAHAAPVLTVLVRVLYQVTLQFGGRREAQEAQLTLVNIPLLHDMRSNMELDLLFGVERFLTLDAGVRLFVGLFMCF